MTTAPRQMQILLNCVFELLTCGQTHGFIHSCKMDLLITMVKPPLPRLRSSSDENHVKSCNRVTNVWANTRLYSFMQHAFSYYNGESAVTMTTAPREMQILLNRVFELLTCGQTHTFIHSCNMHLVNAMLICRYHDYVSHQMKIALINLFILVTNVWTNIQPFYLTFSYFCIMSFFKGWCIFTLYVCCILLLLTQTIVILDQSGLTALF